MVVETSLREQLQAGGVIAGTQLEASLVDSVARSCGYTLFDAQCARAKTKSAVLRAIATAVDFPEYFGGNLDALYDCLTDTVLDQKDGVVLLLNNLHDDAPGLEAHIEAILQVCADASEFAKDNGRLLTTVRCVSPIVEDEPEDD